MSLLREIKIKTAPTVEPVTKAEAKAWIGLKTGYTDDDTLIEDTLIPGARSRAERYLNRSLLSQVRQYYYASYLEHVYIPYGPVISVDSVKREELNVSTTLTENTDYYVQGLDDAFLVIANPQTTLKAGQSPYDRFTSNELLVECTCGYGTAATDVPDEIREAILMMVSESYSERKGYIQGSIVAKFPNTAKAKLAPHRYIPM